LFVLLQPEADEVIGGDRPDDGIEAGRDGAWAETSAWGASAAETVGDDREADAAAALEVWLLKSGFLLGWVIFVEFKWCTKPA
jgi:hypothetical protein